ncbi:ABC transporter permease, partial [Microbacterium sp. H6]
MSRVAEQLVTASVPVRRRPKATLLIGIVLTGLIVLIALVSLFWLPYPLADTSGGRLEGPSALHLLGTDRLGRDLFSQLMWGARIALIVGTCAVAIAALLGT